jgi:alanyl-tRNA synthetase
MHPLVPYLLGEPHPLGKRLVSNQRCLRTDDIDEVGNNRHLTFMEMLGNWSLGDYFKKKQLNWAFEFLTSPRWLGMDSKKLYVSVFKGDQDAPRDEESIAIWQEIFKGVNIEAKVGERIVPYPKKKNWWGPVGKAGPCGPDSEIFYDTGKPHNPRFGSKCHINCDCGRYIEIWNNVFMEYNKTEKGKYERLRQQNVDTGMGVERVTAVLQGKDNIYQTELFAGLKREITSEVTHKITNARKERIRIFLDHSRASIFLLAEKIVPGNKDREYVLRRLIRRADDQLTILGLDDEKKINAWKSAARFFCSNYSSEYKELRDYKGIKKTLLEEVGKYNQLVAKVEKLVLSKKISGKEAFRLVSTFGLSLDQLEGRGFKFDKIEFEKEFKKHQEISRAGMETKFAGGLADHSATVTKYHTTTHLLHQALRDVLGDHVQQVGSNITPERLRFDFTHPKKLTEKQMKKVEKIVNEKIKADLPVKAASMSLAEAKKKGALAFFGEKYGEKVKVYSIGDYSKEVCGGPHLKSTGEIGRVKIVKEKAIGAGRRRIYAQLAHGS